MATTSALNATPLYKLPSAPFTAGEGGRVPQAAVRPPALSDDFIRASGEEAYEAAPRAVLRQPIVGAKRPLLLATAAAGGKLMMAIGASEVVRVVRTPALGDKVLAGVLTGGGLAAAVFAAMQFGQDVHALGSARRAWALKALSISAALTLSAASALRQVLTESEKVGLTWLPFTIATLGFALLCVSLPDFFSFSEAHRGRTVLRHRLVVERALGGSGFATGFAWASYVSVQQQVPPVVGPIILSCAATSVLVSFALFTSDARAAHAMRGSLA